VARSVSEIIRIGAVGINLEDGTPHPVRLYYVAEEDATEAQAIIAKITAPNEKVEAYGPLREAD
jgi:2-methylisocitrate lyase-like PEP mutase family enzyme